MCESPISVHIFPTINTSESFPWSWLFKTDFYGRIKWFHYKVGVHMWEPSLIIPQTLTCENVVLFQMTQTEIKY